MSTSDWKPINKDSNRKCMTLDMHGRRCMKKAKWIGSYHGDPQLISYGDDDYPQWVLTELCELHASKVKR